jgi:hypothetical protein
MGWKGGSNGFVGLKMALRYWWSRSAGTFIAKPYIFVWRNFFDQAFTVFIGKF